MAPASFFFFSTNDEDVKKNEERVAAYFLGRKGRQ